MLLRSLCTPPSAQIQPTPQPQVFDVLQGAALLLDEVDLVLHPLRSELNWPLGDLKPLDVTEGSQPGLRWLLPWFLLDGLLFTRTGKLSVVGLDDNPRAMDILRKLT